MTEASKPNLFLYSLVLPALWLIVGIGMNLVLPGKTLGVVGLVGILFITMAIVSWLFVEKHRRQFTDREGWVLTGYCFLWTFVLEASALWYVLNEGGTEVGRVAMAITVAVTAAVDFLFVWLVVKKCGDRFVSWHLERNRPKGG